VLLVRRVTGVLAAVVAAELLALLGLAPAAHVLAVHPDLPLQFGSPTVDLPSLGARCMPPARFVNLSGFNGSVPRVFTRHHLGTDGRARVDASGEEDLLQRGRPIASGAPSCV
jgi:hypothetical protein